MNRIFNKFNIPKSCEIGNTIYKKLFYENIDMSKKDKEIFTNDIDKIIWRFAFKEDTINIQPYKDDTREYEEIAVIEVILGKDLNIKRICEIIQRTIPYPMVLVFTYQDKILFNVAHKRINLLDDSRNTVEEFIYTDWIDVSNLTDREKHFINSLDIKKFSFSNFYRFYSDVVGKINLFNASAYSNDYFSIMDNNADSIKKISDKINKVEADIMELKSKIKKEMHFNKKMQLNMEIKKLEEKKITLINELNQ